MKAIVGSFVVVVVSYSILVMFPPDPAVVAVFLGILTYIDVRKAK